MRSILYIDDEPALLDIAKIFLEKTGEYSVVTSESANAALQYLQSHPVDAIVADYQMPGMNGIELLVAVRHLYGDLPFILFTGKGREEVVIAAINNGADFYLQKGGDPTAQFAELAHKIKKAVENRLAREALKDSEQRLSDIIEFLPDATFAIDHEGRVIAWNHAIEQMTGIPAADILGKGGYEYAVPFYGSRRPMLIDLIHKSDEEIAKLYSHIVRQKDVLIADAVILSLMGKTVALMGKAGPLYNRGGTIVGAIESIRDITDRKTTEELLQRAQKDWETIFRAVGHPAVVLDAKNTIIDANDVTLRITGKSLDELKGRRCYEVFHKPGTSQPPESCPFEQLKKSGTAGTSEMDIETLNGCYHVSCTPVFDDDGRLLKVIHIALDITARRRAQDELGAAYGQLAASEEILRRQYAELAEKGQEIRQSEEKYRTLVETTGTGFVIIDEQGRVLDANPEYVRLSGHTDLDQIKGRNVTEWTADHDRERNAGAVRQCMRDGLVRNFEIDYTDAAGNITPIEINATVLKSESSVQVITLCRDISARRRVQRALKESEEKFRMLVEANRDMVFSLTHDGIIRYISPQAESQIGYRPEEMEGQDFTRFIHPDDTGMLVAHIREHIRTEGPIASDQFRIRKKDGTYCWFEDKTIYTTDPDGHPVVVGTIRDISNRREAEEALRGSEENYRLLFENLNSGFALNEIILDTNGKPTDFRLIAANPAFEQVTGLKRETQIGRKYLDVYPGTDQSVIDMFGNVALTGIPQSFERYHPVLGRWWHIHAFCPRHGQFAVIINDITERKKAEIALRESEEKYRALVETTSDFIWEVDERGAYSYVSPKVRELLGYEPAEVIGKTPFDLMPPGEADRVAAEFGRCVASRLPITALENQNLKKDGSIITLETSGMPKFDTGGRFAGYRGIDRDISDRKRTEEALQALVKGMVGTTGIDSLDRITESVASWLEADCVMIGKLQPDGVHVDVLSMLLDGKRVTGFGYNLPDTPCENAAEKGFCIYPDNVRQIFPRAKDLAELDIRGYVGTPLKNVEGRSIGVLCVLSRKQIRPDPGIRTIMDIIAVKASAEIERKRMEETLKESAEWSHSILAAAQAGIILVDGESHRIVDANPKALALIGVPRDAVIGTVCHRFICPADKGKCPVTDLHQNVDTSERVLLTASGAAIPVLKTVVPVRISGRDMLVESFIDISELKHSKAALEEINRKLNLLNNITRHDVANQLTVLRGYTELALYTKPEPVIAGFLAKIADTSEMIQRQIDFTRTYQELGMFAPAWQQIGEIIRKVRPGTVTVTVMCESYEIFADHMLERVFFNLFDNAVRHGERVTAITVQCIAADNELVIMVEDNGTGIPLDKKQKIFERGYGRNTGFGLFLAREILAITGIAIYETGMHGKGARFELHVPTGKYRLGS